MRFEKKKTWETGSSIDIAAATVKKKILKKRNTQSNYDKQIWGAGGDRDVSSTIQKYPSRFAKFDSHTTLAHHIR